MAVQVLVKGDVTLRRVACLELHLLGKLDNAVFFWVRHRVSILSIKKNRKTGWSFPPKAVFCIHMTEKMVPKRICIHLTLSSNPVRSLSATKKFPVLIKYLFYCIQIVWLT